MAITICEGTAKDSGELIMRRRVVVTGIGCINPLGNDIETMWSALKEGKSGVGYTTVFDASRFPTKISAEIKDWDITKSGEDGKIWGERARHTRFAAGAAKQAVQMSGVLDDKSLDPTRFGVYLGCGERHAGLCFLLAHADQFAHTRGR